MWSDRVAVGSVPNSDANLTRSATERAPEQAANELKQGAYAGHYSRHCRMSEASQSKPTPNIKTAPIINFPGMEWECGQASSMYRRLAPAKVNVVAQIREMMRLMIPFASDRMSGLWRGALSTTRVLTPRGPTNRSPQRPYMRLRPMCVALRPMFRSSGDQQSSIEWCSDCYGRQSQFSVVAGPRNHLCLRIMRNQIADPKPAAIPPILPRGTALVPASWARPVGLC
jgi:hypothetical protein